MCIRDRTLVAAKAATCTEGGKEAYYKCEGCGKFYEDVLLSLIHISIRNDRKSHRNAVLAVILPNKNGTYSYYDQNNLFPILKENIDKMCIRDSNYNGCFSRSGVFYALLFQRNSV